MSLPPPLHSSPVARTFALKKRRHNFSTSNPSPAQLARYSPPLPPSKACPSRSRMYHRPPSPWRPLSRLLIESPPPHSIYDPSKRDSFFTQCFTNLGLLGRGSFGEVYKVQSKHDGCQYVVKRSARRFRGTNERERTLMEAKNHERLCPHPHLLNFVSAWEERGRLYIQTELCRTSLHRLAENKPPGADEPAAWAYLCDLLSALDHVHSQGFFHLDVKPANVLITDSGRLKLGDFGLVTDLKEKCTEHQGTEGKDDSQEGDPRYMAPELLCGDYGPAADVFSLGVTILELACNIEVPNGGEGWQQLRKGCLPVEFTNGLSTELQMILQRMLTPEPSKRPTVCQLLALNCVKKHSWERHVHLLATEMVLTSIAQLAVSIGCKPSSHPRSPEPLPCTPPRDGLTLPLCVMQDDSGSPEDNDAVFMLAHTEAEPSPTLHRVKSRFLVERTSPLQCQPDAVTPQRPKNRRRHFPD